MGLQFIFGPSGSGKSHELYQTVIKEAAEHPEQNYIVLVPEQFTMQTQKDLVSMHPCRGIMNIDVLSFGRLAYRVFEETGGGNLPVLDDEGKNLILRKIASDQESQLQILRGNIKKLGYISEVKSILSEFTQYDIGEEEIRKVMETAGPKSRLYYKLQDIQVLYREFTEYLKKRYITKEELLDVLSREVSASEMLKNSTVVLDGFTGFTPVQNRLLLELMKCCRKICITVTIDERENPYAYSHPYQLFALSKHMVTGLVRIAKETGIEILDPIHLYEKPVIRFRNNPPMGFLEHNLFRYGEQHYEEEQQAIAVHAARNPKEETMAVAGRIRNLVRVSGYRYREIGVIVSDMDIYGDYLKRAFATYEIPVFLDQKKNILMNLFVEYIRSLLGMAEQNFTYESVFRFLRTGLSGFTMEETDALENYVIGLGIKGYKRWQERWIRRLKGMKTEELDQMNHLRVRLVEKTDSLLYVLRQRKKTVADITEAIYEFMVREQLQLRLKKRENEFQEQGELALAREYAQVYRILIELFDKFVEGGFHIGGITLFVAHHILKAPYSVKEAGTAFYGALAPRSSLFKVAHKHLVHTECICAVFIHYIIGVYNIAAALGHFIAVFTQNHAVAGSFCIRFRTGNSTDIIQELVPETGVQQVQCGMFHTAVVPVYRQPVFHPVPIGKSFVVVGVDITQEIPGGTGPLRHCVCFPLCRAAAAGTCGVYPVCNPCQRAVAFACGFVVCQLWQNQRQLVFRYGLPAALFTVYHGYRLAPVTLAGEYPVAQFIVYLFFAYTFFFQVFYNGLFGFFNAHSVQEAAVCHLSAFAVCISRFGNIAAFDNLDNRQAELGCKLPVALVMAGNSHNGAGAVGSQYIVGNKNRNFLACNRVYGVYAFQHDACLFFGQLGSFHIALFGGSLAVSNYFIIIFQLVLPRIHIFVLRRNYHICGTEQCVRPGCVYFQLMAFCGVKFYLGAVGTADPVFLL